MPTTIAQGFLKLSQNLEITSLQETTASARQKNVRSAVEEEMAVLDTFLTGSYRRSTMIAPLSDADIDIFVVLNSKYFHDSTQASLLDKVKRALLKHYKTSKISRAGQAVTISFTDFTVDVVPGFYRQGGGFLIPDSVDSRWISTDPKKHVDLWASMNTKKNGDFLTIVKMLKQWNRAHSQLLRSFHLESIAYDVFKDVTISSIPSGVRYFFDKAVPLISSGVMDPAGYGGNVGSYLDSALKKQEVIDRLKTACRNALEAESFEKQFKTEEAYRKWRTIFGDFFPVYG